MECLIKYINDEIDSTPPALNKYAIGLYGTSTEQVRNNCGTSTEQVRNKYATSTPSACTESGIFEWDGKEQGADAATFDDPTLSFTNCWVFGNCQTRVLVSNLFGNFWW